MAPTVLICVNDCYRSSAQSRKVIKQVSCINAEPSPQRAPLEIALDLNFDC